jgi:hypothetical protein
METEISIFTVLLVLGFGSFLVYKIYLYFATVKSGGRDKNYYYNRFMRNKEQVERYIESLQHSITLFNCGDEKINTGDNLTVQDHLSKLRNDYDNDYAEVTKKILKRTINRKDKKKYIKLLSDQSEKLYKIERVLREVNSKYRP